MIEVVEVVEVVEEGNDVAWITSTAVDSLDTLYLQAPMIAPIMMTCTSW